MNYINNKSKQYRRSPASNKQKGKKNGGRTTRNVRISSARARPISGVQSLSECALKYATAISEPWSPHAEGACIPIHPSRPSQKIRTFTRFTCTIGTAGVGGFLVMPSLANNANNVLFTGAAFAGADLSAITSATVGCFLAGNNAPYPVASFITATGAATPAVQGRMVSCGVTVQYTGTVFAMGGLYYMLAHPNHQNCATLGTTPILGSFAETLIKRVSAAKEHLVTSSLEIDEQSYYNTTGAILGQQSVYPYSQGQTLNAVDTGTGGAPMVVLITGAIGNTFEVEIVQHIEYVGQSVQAALTPTHGDARGFEIVASAAAKLPSMRVNHPASGLGSLMSSAINGVVNGLRPVAGAIGYGVGTALGGMAGAYMGAPVLGGRLGGGAGLALGNGSAMLRITNG